MNSKMLPIVFLSPVNFSRRVNLSILLFALLEYQFLLRKNTIGTTNDVTSILSNVDTARDQIF